MGIFPLIISQEVTDRWDGRFQITGGAVTNIWTSFRQSGSLEPNPAKGQPRILDETDLDLAQVLKQIAPSMAYKDLKEYIERYSAKVLRFPLLDWPFASTFGPGTFPSRIFSFFFR